MSNNTEFRAVQVGCGAMGRGWIEHALKVPGLKLVGLVDVVRESAAAAAEKFHLPPEVVFTDLNEALAKTNADVVFDVTVPSAHEGVVISALNTGRHVLGEKPMSESLDSAKRMVAAANAAGKTYAVTQNYRYQPAIRALKGFLSADKIGPVEEIHADFFIGAHFGGFRDQMDYPLILDMSIHTFDAARFLTGADPVSVYCHSFNPKRSWYKGDASAIVIFEMGNGIVFNYRGSWCAEGQITDWNSNWRVIGHRGSVLWDGKDGFRAQAIKPGGNHKFLSEMDTLELPIPPLAATAHLGVMLEFFESLRQNRKPETDCTDNIKSLAMVLAAVNSAKSGKKELVQW